ncbi:D-arabitol-phosphate dehydrogenase [Streptomyces alboniger]
MTTMRALRAQRDASTLVLEDIPVPEPGPMDVVVRVASAGLAPGIMHLLKMGAFKHLPTTLGFEAAGTIAAVGSDAAGVHVGDRVRAHTFLNCRTCIYCRTDRDMMCPQQSIMGYAAFNDSAMPLYDEYHNGVLAEYVRLPYWLVDPLPESISFDVAAKVHTLANAVRALKWAELPMGSTVVVTAATGAMGTATVKIAKHFGVADLILVGRHSDRLKAVAELSGGIPADIVALDELPDDWAATGALAGRLRELVPGGAHAVLDYVPDGPVTGQAMGGLAAGGALVHMGGNRTPLPQPPMALMLNMWRFIGTRACTRNDALEVLRLLETGALTADELITHRFPLSDVVEAIGAVQRRDQPMWMPVINP